MPGADKTLDSFVLTYSQLRALPVASKDSVKNVEDWLCHNRTAVAEQESDFIKKEDLVSMEIRSNSTSGEVFEKHVASRIHGLWKQKAPDERNHQENQILRFLNDIDRAKMIATLHESVFRLVALIMPLWILEILQDPSARLGLITACFVAFFGDHTGCYDV